LTYGRLYRHVAEMEGRLRTMGIGRRDRVVLVLPNGPEMALAFLTVAASTVCAPLNPAYEAEELERCFADLRPRALITQAGFDAAARLAARSHNVPVIELSAAVDGEAGLFTLTGERGRAHCDEPVSPGSMALLLPTSGTTSRPKLVPLTHFNICTSAYASVAATALGEADRCLSVLPLYYGLGLNGTVLASLAAGASVVCTPGCDVTRFFAWLTDFRPTWCAAVPTMLQAILAHARLTGERGVDCPLRFIRTATAPLPRPVFTELEQIFEAPVINFYGMTETSSAPIAISPLPPRRRKPGSVGMPFWLDVAIMGEGGAFLPRGETGQVAVRGASVMSGYDGAPLANQAAFAGDWFKTGDNGFFDDNGYLFLVGRSQEFINRGGEKIAPQEIDDVLLEHPAVAEAVTFAVPHPTLGEEVAAAVVLRPHAVATPRDIRQFAIGRIADFKIPRQVVVATELPKGPTGKLQRIGLAAKLGFANHGRVTQPFVAPSTPVEKVLAGIWAEVLQVERVGVNDDFFALGGDSLLATHFLVHLHEAMHIEVEASSLFEASTVGDMARHIETLIQAGPASRLPSAIVRVPRENGVAPASFAQERLWKLQQALPDIPFFNILYALRLTSAVDAAVLERCINEIVRRHESLRTTFILADGRTMQVIAPQLTVPLALHDLRALLPGEKESIGHELIQDELVHSFDLGNGPLIRTSLAHLDDREHLLFVSMHQTICDGWSLGVFVDELVALYDAFTDGRESPLAPLSIQYADFAHWQRDWPLRPEMVAQLEYWQEQLREPMPVMRLAKSDARRTVDDLRTVRRSWALPASLAEAAKRFSHQEGGTLFMALVAALQALLHRYLGQDDIRVVTNVANRNRRGTQSLIGHLVNSVTLRTDLGGDPTAREVLRRVRATTLGAFARQDFPFEELVATLERERRLTPLPLSNIMISLQNPALRPAASAGRKLSFEEANPNMLMPLVTVTSFEIILMLRESGEGLVGTCVYKPHRFGASTIDRLLRDFQEVLERMATQPDRPISAIRVLLKEQIRLGK
jgi:acyl-CoA synthetase (AMP-forming)/AMP-acid ligase II/acyl carrier protein